MCTRVPVLLQWIARKLTRQGRLHDSNLPPSTTRAHTAATPDGTHGDRDTWGLGHMRDFFCFLGGADTICPLHRAPPRGMELVQLVAVARGMELVHGVLLCRPVGHPAEDR